MTEAAHANREVAVMQLIERYGQELLKSMALRERAKEEWGVDLVNIPPKMSPDSMLDYIVAESADMVFEVTEHGCVDVLFMELDGVVYAVPFQPSRSLRDAIWASIIVDHGFDNEATDPLVVCASTLGRL